jgi:hypothetical protein
MIVDVLSCIPWRRVSISSSSFLLSILAYMIPCCVCERLQLQTRKSRVVTKLAISTSGTCQVRRTCPGRTAQSFKLQVQQRERPVLQRHRHWQQAITGASLPLFLLPSWASTSPNRHNDALGSLCCYHSRYQANPSRRGLYASDLCRSMSQYI